MLPSVDVLTMHVYWRQTEGLPDQNWRLMGWNEYMAFFKTYLEVHFSTPFIIQLLLGPKVSKKNSFSCSLLHHPLQLQIASVIFLPVYFNNKACKPHYRFINDWPWPWKNPWSCKRSICCLGEIWLALSLARNLGVLLVCRAVKQANLQSIDYPRASDDLWKQRQHLVIR